MKQFIYSFNEGSKEMRNLLGNKGANIAEMMQIGLPVPFGFTITTKACSKFYENGCELTTEMEEEIFEKITELEDVTGKTFGGGENPLLVSVRTDAAVSMPGLAETILNLGINDETAEALCKIAGDRSFAEDIYQRFKQMYRKTVGCPEEEAVPQDVRQQLVCAVKAAFLSWESEEAKVYRAKLASEPSETEGVAVNIQAMVFGNLGENSAVGMATTRNCETGEKELSGSFVVKTQGKDITDSKEMKDISKLTDNFPKAYESLIKISGILEKHYKDVQNMEFTIENNKLYMLQTSTADRTAEAALKIAVDMVSEEIIMPKTAILRQDANNMEGLVSQIRQGQGEKITALKENYRVLMDWVDDVRELKVRVNVDSEEQARNALELGAEGIGLCRSENMICESGEMLETFKQNQRSEFERIYRVMGEKPVTIRLLDLPVTLPEITEIQTEAIIEAALAVGKETENNIEIEILVPMVSTLEEFKRVKKRVEKAAMRCTQNVEHKPEILVGTMIETPRAALIADKIAAECDFFSFGTNDLTQMVFGLSRDEEATDVIEDYIANGILKENPFRTLDVDGVGRLVEFAASMGRHTKPKLKLGICGEQASDARSIEFCHKIGMNYLSCQPAKVPAAKLAAAQAAVRNEVKEI